MIEMIFRKLLPIAIWLLTAPLAVAQPQIIDLYTFEAPPYQTPSATRQQSKQVDGETVDAVLCACDNAGWTAQVRLAPQNRALHSLKRSEVDGYFAVAASAQLDAEATRSHPVALEKWYFFSATPSVDLDQARIGVVGGSNEEAWLKANHYPVFLSVRSQQQLVALLQHRRIDAALMDQRVMHFLNPQGPDLASPLYSRFLRYAPLHMYVSERFSLRHPDFMNTFNRVLPDCLERHIALSEAERASVRNLSIRLMTDLDTRVDLAKGIREGPRVARVTEILRIDRHWQANAPQRAIGLAEDILDLPTSRALDTWVHTQNGLVTEAILMNTHGTVAAMSRLTSDYWQGDEPKFRQIWEAPGGASQALYVSPIRFDASTSRFQITVSRPVGPFNGGLPTGIIALGIDVENNLQQVARK